MERVGPNTPTKWSSPIHLQPKPDGSLRPCGDFRGLNGKTILDKYPLPNINHFNSKIKGAKIFSKLNLVKAEKLSSPISVCEMWIGFCLSFQCQQQLPLYRNTNKSVTHAHMQGLKTSGPQAYLDILASVEPRLTAGPETVSLLPKFKTKL